MNLASVTTERQSDPSCICLCFICFFFFPEDQTFQPMWIDLLVKVVGDSNCAVFRYTLWNIICIMDFPHVRVLMIICIIMMSVDEHELNHYSDDVR